MAYKIGVDKSSGIVNVTYSGTVSLDMRKQAVEDVCEIHDPLEPLNILVDVRKLIMDLSLEEQKLFGRYLASREELMDAKVAVLHTNDYNPNLAIDVHAFNSGYQLAEFSALSQAVDWLTCNT
jgi:hypothetical protein